MFSVPNFCLQLAVLHRMLSVALKSISRTMRARVEYVRANIALCGEIKSTFKAGLSNLPFSSQEINRYV